MVIQYQLKSLISMLFKIKIWTMLTFLVGILFSYENVSAQNLDAYYTWQFIPSEAIKNDPNQQTYYQNAIKKYPYILSIRAGKSMFQSLETIADAVFIDDEGYKTTIDNSNLRAYKCFKDFNAKKIVINYNSFFKLYTLKDQLTSYDWKLENEFKDISGYKCRKATCFDMLGNEVIAWYSEDIPVSNGPKEFGGLPGLIVWLSAARSEYTIQKIVLNPKSNPISFTIPTGGKEMTIREFTDQYSSTKKKYL